MQKLITRLTSGSFEKRKRTALILSIVFDSVGVLTYIFPGLGETFDFVWAPIAGMINVALFGGWLGVLGGLGTFTEEILPFTDFIPSFLLMWFVKFVILEKRTRRQMAEKNAETVEVAHSEAK